MTACLSTVALDMTGIFATPEKGNFKSNFIDNLALWSSPDTPMHMGGAGIIGATTTLWFSYYSLPSANSFRKK